MEYFNEKAPALKALPPGQILANKNIKKYFHTQSLQTLLDVIKQDNNPCYYEYIPSTVPVNLFFDIEIYKSKNLAEYTGFQDVLQTIKDTIKNKYPLYTKRYLILESHDNSETEKNKKSLHVIVRMVDDTGNNICFDNIENLKSLVTSFPQLSHYIKSKIVDTSVYREGLFRTIHSSKAGENRPLIVSELSDALENELDTFVTWSPGPNIVIGHTRAELTIPADREVIVNVPEELSTDDKIDIKKYVKASYHHNPSVVRDISVNESLNCITVSLKEVHCEFLDREHTSNHQYIIIDTVSSKQKCHDSDCEGKKHKEISIQKYPKYLLEIIKKCLKINSKEIEMIEACLEKVSMYIGQHFDEKVTVNDVTFNKDTGVFNTKVHNRNLTGLLRGTCKECRAEHEISNTGYCVKCTVCKSVFPNVKIPVESEQILQFFVNYPQLINHGTININIGGEYDASLEFTIADGILNDKILTKLVNESLDGHKITKISEILSNRENDFVYIDNTWYHFDGCVWHIDKEDLQIKLCIQNLVNTYRAVQRHYENLKTDVNSVKVIRNIKALDNKLHDPAFQSKVLTGSKCYFNDNTFLKKLNSKKHLVPFSNGVYDLLKNEFRNTRKEDYVNLTFGYKLDKTVKNVEVTTFLNQVLPNQAVRDYVLKKMSECLNGDIPNTNFLMFIGESGANGKSQLLNLMRHTMGDFGDKVEVTLLTRKRNNANETNSEKVKLMNKRYAFLSEPEDGEKINVSLLKELTGSEEVVARGLYQDSISFIMEAKLFLACNELPEIKAEDTALWRRIRVVDFPSRFVEEPKSDNEYLIDKSLPSRMREDVTWRQTFMNILLEYYFKDVKEPEEVKMKTNEYRQENNDFYNWADENLELQTENILKVSDVCQLYLNKTKIHSSVSTKYRKELEKYIKEKYTSLKWEFGSVRVNEQTGKGWLGLGFKT